MWGGNSSAPNYFRVCSLLLPPSSGPPTLALNSGSSRLSSSQLFSSHPRRLLTSVPSQDREPAALPKYLVRCAPNLSSYSTPFPLSRSSLATLPTFVDLCPVVVRDLS